MQVKNMFEYVALPSERDDVLESKWPLVDVRVGKKADTPHRV